MDPQIPGNSNSARQKQSEPEEPRVTKIISGAATTRKPPMGRRFRQTFFGGDASTVRSYMVFDVIVPYTKDMIADATSGAIDRILFPEGRGGSRRRGGSSGSGSGTYNSYGRYSRSGPEREEPRRDVSRRGRSQHEFDEIVIPDRFEADLVLDKMYELLSKYKEVKVSDLYDACDVTWTWTDNKWGWTSLQGAHVERVRSGGYILNLPKPEPLK